MLRTLAKLFNKDWKRKGFYDGVTLTPEEIAKQGYQQYLGGGAAQWNSRGAFQLYFLQKMGLQPGHRFLDIGCGPLRGGSYVIGYLEPGKYYGVDYHAGFIEAAHKLVQENPALAAKQPTIAQADDFGFGSMPGKFEYVLLFSVLNHCSGEQIEGFFRGLHQKLAPGAKVYITHATWFQEVFLQGTALTLTRRVKGEGDIAPDVKMEQWGWSAAESIFPILEVGLDPRATT